MGGGCRRASPGDLDFAVVVTPPAHRVVCPLPRVRPGGALEPPLPVAAHPVDVLDRLAASAVEVGVVFNALTLVTGSIWGRPTWGVWWTWDARLTSTALLLVLFLGYMALRRVPAEPEVRAKRCAVAALFAFRRLPIVHFSVVWWQTLHQGDRPQRQLSPTIHGSMAWTLLLASWRSRSPSSGWWRSGTASRCCETRSARRSSKSPSRSAAQRAGPSRRASRRPGHANDGAATGRSLPAIRAHGGLMSYVDAGYIIAFSVLFLYVVSLLVRRRRLERAVANVAPRGDAVQPSASQDARRDNAEDHPADAARHQSAGADRGTVCA